MQQGDGNRNLQNGRRIARNAVLLYLRMFLLMFIGLFTSRVVLRELGVEDYGVWNAVGGVVTMFTFITTSISSAISRYLAFEIGRSDSGRLRQVFATGMAVQLLLSLLLVLLVETAGAWFLNAKMVIPAPRMDAARFVLHCSLGVLVLNMLSVPFNAAIIAHERMSAFAWISLGEAALKLLVALLLSVSVFDKLETYALLMLAVALLVRVTYGIYCRRNFEESRARPVFDRRLFREMAGFAGWSFFGSGAGVLNVQGSSLLVNMFFGVAMNAARGVASQVEAVVKQFAVNFLTAVNPQITKSWASGDRGYCYSLVAKGSKFAYLAILLFTVPIVAEADYLLQLWLGNVLYTVSIAAWIYALFRIFSKNLTKRRSENQRWLNWMWRMKSSQQGAKARHADKAHKYFTCKNCKTICRVPVGKGKIIITCPKCGAQIHART